MSKTCAIIMFLVVCCATPSFAQDSTSSPEVYPRRIAVGPVFLGGGAVNAGDVADGYKTSTEFAYSVGAIGAFPISQSIGVQVFLGYDSRQISFHPQASTSPEWSYGMGYIALRPEFNFSGFLLGFGLGMPIGSDGFALKDLNALYELRIGANIPLYVSRTGTLNFLCVGSYELSHLSDKPLIGGSGNSGPLATLEAGFCYTFDLSHENGQL